MNTPSEVDESEAEVRCCECAAVIKQCDAVMLDDGTPICHRCDFFEGVPV